MPIIYLVAGARPNFMKIAPIVRAIQAHGGLSYKIIHTGQHYDREMNDVFFEELGIPEPDVFMAAGGGSHAQQTGKIMVAFEEYCQANRPDAVLVVGDVNSTLACSIVAKKLCIPVAHVEAGLRSGDMSMPEEINRRIVDHTADINLTYSDIAREYLLAEGLPPDRVIKTGSPMCEVLAHYAPKIAASDALTRLNLQTGRYFVVSAHREENIESERNFAGLVETLNTVAATCGLPVVVSTHPRTRKRMDAMGVTLDDRVHLLKPLGFSDYVRLQQAAKAVLSDSGTINEEASILNFRALNLRDAHERPEGMEEGAVMMVGMNTERVMQGLRILESQPVGQERLLRQVADYSMPNVSEKVVRIIHSYVDYVNQVVWKKR